MEIMAKEDDLFESMPLHVFLHFSIQLLYKPYYTAFIKQFYLESTLVLLPNPRFLFLIHPSLSYKPYHTKPYRALGAARTACDRNAMVIMHRLKCACASVQLHASTLMMACAT